MHQLFGDKGLNMITASKGWLTGGGQAPVRTDFLLPLEAEIVEVAELEGEIIEVTELSGEYGYES